MKNKNNVFRLVKKITIFSRLFNWMRKMKNNNNRVEVSWTIVALYRLPPWCSPVKGMMRNSSKIDLFIDLTQNFLHKSISFKRAVPSEI
jgi:hypothetical protein